MWVLMCFINFSILAKFSRFSYPALEKTIAK